MMGEISGRRIYSFRPAVSCFKIRASTKIFVAGYKIGPINLQAELDRRLAGPTDTCQLKN